ncbi:3-dehydroquinate synthase [Candidatus Micrarchaeota archaeon]|nr:3-dehydroquinate synthase [Candidatus Micrarchaeota archaeon]
MEKIRVNALRPYDVLVGAGVLGNLGKDKRSIVITQPGARAVAEKVRNAIGAKWLYELPDGEKAKTLEEVRKLYEFALSNGIERKDKVYAVGGGCAGDAAGFFAATYMRGMPLVHVPTTILAQVDSGIGGKVGVNFGGAKNIVGAIYQPEAVYMDISVLAGLPEKHLRNGLAEAIKYGLILDAGFFGYLEKNVGKALAKDEKVLEKIVADSVRAKAKVVEKDEFESGERMKLNYGHTIGHGIEAVTGMLHGEAIAIGMAAEILVAKKKGLVSESEVERQNKLLEKTGLPLKAKASLKEVMAKIKSDKKRSQGKARMVLLEGIGKSKVEEVEDAEIEEVLREVLE